MHEDIEYTQLDSVPGQAAGASDLRRLRDVPVELAVEIGRTKMTIGVTLGLGPGCIVTLNHLAGEPVDLLVNGKPIARGEVVAIDEEFGLRVTEIVSPLPALQQAAESAEPVIEPVELPAADEPAAA